MLFRSIVTDSYYISFFWSIGLAFTTVVILLVICYPVSYGMAKIFGPWANLVTIIIAVPLLISENIRLFGWVLFLLKNGIADGSLHYLFDVHLPSILYTVPAIVLGLWWRRGSAPCVLASFAGALGTLFLWPSSPWGDVLHAVFPAVAASVSAYVLVALFGPSHVDTEIDRLFSAQRSGDAS